MQTSLELCCRWQACWIISASQTMQREAATCTAPSPSRPTRTCNKPCKSPWLRHLPVQVSCCHPSSTFPQSPHHHHQACKGCLDAAAVPGRARDLSRITEGLAKLGYTLRRISSLGRSSKALQVAPIAASAAVLPPIRAAADGPPSSIPSDSAGSAHL